MYRSMLILPVGISRYLCLFVLFLAITACSDVQKMDIEVVLDARNSAVSTGNINAYSSLLIPSYQNGGQSKSDVVSNMLGLFGQFEAMEMITFGRTIRMLDDSHAQCEQTCHLRAKADNRWRKINQREQILLTKTASGWQISGGL